MASVPGLSVRVAGIELKNPIIAASGTFGYGQEFSEFFELRRLGAISVKGTSAEPMAGNLPPRLFPTPSGMLNSIGLENVGVDAFIRDKMPFLRQSGCTVLVNVFGYAMEDYIDVVEKLNACEGIAAYELNISCPNTKEGGMVFGTSPALTRELTLRVRDRAVRPVIVKLSPNVTDIAEMARAAEDGGADALTVANTFLAMAIDPRTRRPRVHTLTGGLSGPAIRPIVVRMVYQCCRAVRIPVIGLGGIATGEDVAEYLLAGATAVQVGTSNFHDPRATTRILAEFIEFLSDRRIQSASDLIGKMET